MTSMDKREAEDGEKQERDGNDTQGVQLSKSSRKTREEGQLQAKERAFIRMEKETERGSVGFPDSTWTFLIYHRHNVLPSSLH